MPRPRLCGPRTGAVTVAACLLVLLHGCTIEEPTLPTYETEWLIPLGEYEETVAEIVEDEPDFVVGADGSISLTASGEIDGVSVGDELDVEVDGFGFDAAIGNVGLDASDPIGFDHRLGDLYPDAEMVDGMAVPVPPFTFDLASDPQDIPGFRSATLASGGLRVLVDNGLPVPVGGTSPPEQLRIALVDPETGGDVLAFTVDAAIPSGATFDRIFDLSGRTLPDSVNVTLVGGSSGSPTPVTVDADARLAVEVATLPLEVATAEASFGPQEFRDTTAVEMPDSVRIRSAVVGQGRLSFRVRNDLPLDAVATIDIGAFVSPTGNPLQIVLPLDAETSETRTIELADYTLAFDGGPGEDLEVVADVHVPGTEGAYVEISSTDVIRVTVDPIALSFRSVTGIVDPITIDLEPETTDLDIPDDLDDLQLQRAELALGFTTSLGMPIAIRLHVEGTNAQGGMVPLDTEIDLPAVSGSDPELVNVVLDEQNSDVVAFLNNLPETVVFSGTARVGDGVSEGTVASSDSVAARWAIRAPMTVALLAQEINGDATELDLDDSTRRDLDQRLIGLTLEADVTSTLPIEAVAYIGIASDSTSTHTRPELELGPITIPAAGPARPDGGRDGVVSKTVVEVAEKDVGTITQPFAWQGVRLVLPGTDGEFVTLRSTDEVRVRGFLRARILMGDVEE
ncbi:MAG TPA: hypothetical protein VKA86_01150 [Candidatus Krumholzibacteria bacterium]|nr:hypothetical protein [Candidatus Krumholzibacteria bacterium]